MKSAKAEAPIDAGRVRILLQLANRLHAGPLDPMYRKRETVEGLVAMTAADYGACALLHDDGGPAPVILSAAFASRRRARTSRRGLTAPPDDVDQRLLRRLTEAARSGGTQAGGAYAASVLTSVVALDRTGTFGGLAMARDSDAVSFKSADRDLVGLFHAEMRWIYELDLPLASPDVVSLSPRVRATLQCLLAGLSEKQIASQLELSHNTIHHYVKLLYRHFLVSSRSELLARWFHEKRGA